MKTKADNIDTFLKDEQKKIDRCDFLSKKINSMHPFFRYFYPRYWMYMKEFSNTVKSFRIL